ncbi:MAG TPA: hypothetical protein P5022_18380, partial [Candidatus Paceibacterota bacterium]|nr:hypothetical protein [Candidatus Paceibacterota bacterium]
ALRSNRIVTTERLMMIPPGKENLPDLAVRDGRWKLLCEFDGLSPQLYDLDQDPAETSNLAARHPDIVRRLAASVRQWHESVP